MRLYIVDSDEKYDDEWTEVYDVNENFTWATWIEFWDDIYIVWTEWVFR